MATTRSEQATLNKWETSLTNCENQPQIAEAMGEIGYGPEKIGEGKLRLSATVSTWRANKTEDDESDEASAVFYNEYNNYKKQYRKDRKKAKVVFDNPVILSKLKVDCEVPDSYDNFMEHSFSLYNELTKDITLVTEMSLMKVGPDEVVARLDAHAKVKATRQSYLKERGESENATKLKNEAMNEMDQWMRKFYKVAKIALEDSPQLLESLGMRIK